MQDPFHEEFDLEIYKINNKDLENLTDEELSENFKSHGINEGRVSNICNRDFLQNCSLQFELCLEIGPFDCPIIKGDNVKYFDVLDRDNLIVRSKQCGRSGVVPEIHYVEENGNLEVINDKFDMVLSCHSIEHQPDFIRHLQRIENILNNGGYYTIICPDKRYCFDHFIEETTIADILYSYYNKSIKHSIKSVIEHRVLTCHNDSVRHWNGDHGLQTIDNDETSLQRSIDEFNNNSVYIDVHAWQFTPDSFEYIINKLRNLGMISFKVHRKYHTIKNMFEFTVILKK